VLKRSGAICSAILITLTLSGVLTPARAAGSVVRLGYQYSLWGAPAVVALELDLFKKHGIEVEAKRFGAGKDARDGLVSNNLDVATVGGTPFVVGAVVGELNAIATVAYTGRTGCIEVKKGAGIKSLDQLKSKKVATRTGSTIDSVFRKKIIPAYGLKETDLTMVNVDFQDQAAALAAGSVDAFAGVEPFCTLAESLNYSDLLLDYEKYDSMPNMLASTSAFVKGNPNAAKAVVAAMSDAAEMFQKDPDKVAEILYKVYKEAGYPMDAATLKKLISRLDVNPKFVPGLDKYFENEAQDLIKAGRLRGNVDWSKVLITDFLPGS